MYAIFRTAAGTWHVIPVPDNVALLTYAETSEEALEQLEVAISKHID